jgi:hypothetical protein
MLNEREPWVSRRDVQLPPWSGVWRASISFCPSIVRLSTTHEGSSWSSVTPEL